MFFNKNKLRGDSMNFIIIGHSGLSKVIRDVILSVKDNEIIGYLDDTYKEITLIGDSIFAPIHSAKSICENFSDIKLVIAFEDTKTRKQIHERLDLPDTCYESIVHKSAMVSSSIKIGRGTVVMPNVVINEDTQIGDHVIIETGSIIEHGCKIQSFSHIGAGAVLLSGVQVGEGIMIGAGTTVRSNDTGNNSCKKQNTLMGI
jgi:acetyltransferase EpsM